MVYRWLGRALGVTELEAAAAVAWHLSRVKLSAVLAVAILAGVLAVTWWASSRPSTGARVHEPTPAPAVGWMP